MSKKSIRVEVDAYNKTTQYIAWAAIIISAIAIAVSLLIH